MASEITVTATLSAAKNNASISISGTKSIDMAGQDMVQVTQQLSATPELINLSDITQPAAYIFIRNLETETTSVHLSLNSDGSNKFATLKPGQFCLFPQAVAQNIYLFADPLTAIAQVAAVEA